MFCDLIWLLVVGILIIVLVFGNFIVGGVYVFGMFDYVVMIKECFKVFLVGLLLVKMVIGEEFDDELLGGVEMYVCILGLVDYFVFDEFDVICIGCCIVV